MDFKLGKIREERNMSRQFFAPLIGVAENTLCDYENGKRRPSYEKLIRIAEQLHVSLDYLTGLTDKEWVNSVVSASILARIHPGRFIREIRKNRGITVEAASKQTSFNVESFSLMEAGHIPLPAEDIDTIADNLAMTDEERGRLMSIVCDEDNYSFLDNGIFIRSNKQAARIIRLIIILKDEHEILDDVYRYIKHRCAET